MSAETHQGEFRHWTIAGIGRAITSQGILIAFVLLCVVLGLSNEFFFTWNNWTNIIRQTSINGILAIGVTFVILTGGIDLSVGSVMAFCGAITASIVVHSGAGMVLLAALAGIAAGLLLGAANGIVVAFLRVPPFVVTLGMLSVARGLTFIYSDGRPISNLSPEFLWIGNSTVIGVPIAIVALVVVFAISWFVLSFMVFGRYVYAVGGSERTAKTNGIRTRLISLSTYVISGGLASIAGILLCARSTAALPQAGVAYELDAIAAVVIGGTSLSGGRGTLIGTLFGALIIGTINNGLDLMGISSYYQQVIKGIIIVGAVLMDVGRRD